MVAKQQQIRQCNLRLTYNFALSPKRREKEEGEVPGSLEETEKSGFFLSYNLCLQMCRHDTRGLAPAQQADDCRR